MDSLLLVLGTIVLILTCLVLTMLVLMQRPASSGMGSAISGGDGIAASAFGTESSKVLRKLSIYAIVVFFVLCFVLYLGNIAANQDNKNTATDVLDISVPEASTTIEVNEEAVPADVQSSIEEAADAVESGVEKVEEAVTEGIDAASEKLETINVPEPSTK